MNKAHNTFTKPDSSETRETIEGVLERIRHVTFQMGDSMMKKACEHAAQALEADYLDGSLSTAEVFKRGLHLRNEWLKDNGEETPWITK